MTSSTLGAVDPSIDLAHTLDEFEQVLQLFPFVDAEERQDAILAYKKTSKGSLESFLESLSRQIGIRKEGILRIVGLFNLLRPFVPQPEASRPNGIPSTLFGVLKATLIAGHRVCGDLAVVTAKFDHLSRCTSTIRGDELNIAPEEVVQGLLARLASRVVECCSKILRLSEYL
jgi:hypothetical protein